METQNAIDVLNSLIEINNDRIEGYKTASKETEETDLITLFGEFEQTSQNCKAELVTEVIRLGGVPIEGTTTSGKFFRIWMDMKAAITGKNRKLILDSCEFGENAALETYKNALIQEHHDTTIVEQNMLNKHYGLLKSDLDKVSKLRDAADEKKDLLNE